MVDLLWTLIGFVAGVVAAAFAVELGLKKFFSPPESAKLTSVWSLGELSSPLVAATNLSNVPVPAKARVVTAANYTGDRAGFELRRNTEITGNFAVDAKVPRALLFLGDPKPGALALWTVDEKLIERLRAEFHRHWSRSTDHVEKVSVSDVVKKPNLTIQTQGVVQDILPYRGTFLMRLNDGGETVGVMVDRDLPLRGKPVSVTGIVKLSGSGYPLVEALEVQALA